MAAMMRRWIGLGEFTKQSSTSQPTSCIPANGKKRNHADFRGGNENEESFVATSKRVKRAFIDMSNTDDNDNIAVAHRPLADLNARNFANSSGELSEEQFAKKARRKLYVKPVLLDPKIVASYAPSGAPNTAVRKPAVTSPKSRSSLVRPKSHASKVSAQVSGPADLRRMFGSRALSPELPRPLNPDHDDGNRSVKPAITSEDESPCHGSRRTARKSYKNMDLAESEDEPATNRGGSHSKAARKSLRRKEDDDDDFVIEPEQEVESEVDDEGQLDHDLGAESSSNVSFNEDIGDEDERRSKPVRRSRAIATENGGEQSKSKASRGRMLNLRSGNVEAKKVNYSLPPLSAIDDIFQDISCKALGLGLRSVIERLNERPIRVATMCSGTESPLLALQMIGDCLSKLGLDAGLVFEHLFSGEIIPFKQAYIERNFSPDIIFRDITELTRSLFEDEDNPTATTAYGGKVPVPKDVDVLIAGTSCVDFSGLNTHQKGLDDGGESADTWKAVLTYSRAFRPTIVLLENVSMADWDRMLSDYENINYECAGVMVNTRDYYIPQIRERGYMVCFNKQSPSYSPGLAHKWERLMEKFKRPASSPVSDFLLPNDQITQKLVRNDEPMKPVDWRQCEITQMEYRQDKRLGWARPYTHWSESGKMLPPDNGHAPWFNKQVERVLDTLDGALLRKAKDMYDMGFKSRIFDLSQNIYRETDHRSFGISGCITPSGMYYVTDQARILTSEETLKLQGIPLERISFTTETQSEIQSLAGNAMSSTVIGSAILSALIAGSHTIDVQGREPRCLSRDDEDRKLIASSSTKQLQSESIDLGGLDLNSLLENAKDACRRCYCEGTAGTAEKPIQQCSDCGHTTCISCGGNPAHNYRQGTLQRMSPTKFKEYAQSVLPLRLSLAGIELRGYDNDWLSAEHGKAATKALQSSFSFCGIRRTHCWTITYRSEDAVLELVISPTSSSVEAQWRLYSTPSKDLPGNSPLRRMMEQPIARSSTLHGSDSLDACTWSLRIPKANPEALAVTITGSGPKVPSWWSRMEMPDFADHSVSSFLSVQVGGASNVAAMVTGEYQYLPRCGKACSSLYRKMESDKEEPVFLFLDPTRTDEPENDCFVFSKSVHLLEKDEVRPVVARICSAWRPWPTNGTRTAATPKLLIDESWLDMPGCTLVAASDARLAISRATDPKALVNSAECSELAGIISCTVPSAIVAMEKSKEQHVVRADDAKFFNTHAWLFEAMRRYLPQSDWHVFHEPIQGRAHTHCEFCAPPRPALRWGLSADGADLKPYEDPRGASLYERVIKARPDAIAVIVSNAGHTLSLGLDIATLAHRAGARLPQDLQISYQWRFTTSKHKFSFTPFRLTNTTGVAPYEGDLQMTIQLFPKQLMSLSWMKRQEMGVDIEIEEGEEASIGALGWQAEVRATTTKTIRGGICADHPGFGKTIISLALIHSEFRGSTATKMQDALKPRANGYLPHAGTLIVCPASLIEQWVEEIQNKLGYKKSLCVLKKITDLSKHTIQEFQDFKIVVVNRLLLTSDAYIERLAAFAGIPGPVSSKGRPFTQWLNFAHQQIPPHLVERKKGHFRKYIETVYRERVNSDEFKAAVPSKRLTGADYIAGKEKKVTSAGTKVRAKASVDTSHLDKPLLQMFYWNRVIVDEFHQPEAKPANVIVASMRPDKCWGLSATPALGDFYEVARMGELIGVPLRIGSDGAGMMKNASVKELRKDMTGFELFDAMRQVPSDSMHQRIHDIDQKFMDTFVRQNIMDHDELRYQDHLVPVALDLDHGALYTELSQHLNSADMRIRKKTKATDRDKHFNEAVSTSTSAEEALSKVAAFSRRGNAGAGDILNLQKVVHVRHAAVDRILSKIPTAMSEAKGTEVAFDNLIKSRLEEGTLGDGETCKQLLQLAKAAKGIKITAAKLASRGDAYGKGKRALTAYLNGLCNLLLIERRSARYMQNLFDLQRVAGGDNVEIECDDPECATIKSLDVAISALCGHMICRECYTKRRETVTCPSKGCSNPMADHHLFWPNKLGNLEVAAATPYGAKINAAVKLLRKIQARNEQAILFVQFDNQLDEVEMALKDAGIGATIVKNVEKAGLQMQAFREAAGTKERTVIVLNSSDETAAGSNLQNANHVIFLSPLLKDTQYGYDSTMAQTIGRVRRPGQTKEIHIYRLVALDTIDVDILEQRERRSDALVEQGAAKIVKPQTAILASSSKERTQLIRDEDGKFSLQPQSWLIDPEAQGEGEVQKVKGKSRVLGYEEFTSIVKFSKNFTNDDD